jgi:hypothetical protein
MRLSSREWLLWRSAIKGSYWPVTAIRSECATDRFRCAADIHATVPNFRSVTQVDAQPKLYAPASNPLVCAQ